MCCIDIPFILDIKRVDAPAGVAQEEGQTVFSHLPFAVLALIFIARRIHPSLSVVDREAEFCVYPRLNHSPLLVGHDFFFFVRKNLGSRDCTDVCVCVCVRFLPIHSGLQWTYQPGSHRKKVTQDFHPPSFCGACLNFSREKDSAIPFPRRP